MQTADAVVSLKRETTAAAACLAGAIAAACVPLIRVLMTVVGSIRVCYIANSLLPGHTVFKEECWFKGNCRACYMHVTVVLHACYSCVTSG